MLSSWILAHQLRLLTMSLDSVVCWNQESLAIELSVHAQSSKSRGWRVLVYIDGPLGGRTMKYIAVMHQFTFSPTTMFQGYKTKYYAAA